MAEIGKDLVKAKRLLEAGELVAIPTETVYGLAGNALNVKAVTTIFEVKNRPHFDPLIVHVYSLERAQELVQLVGRIGKVMEWNFASLCPLDECVDFSQRVASLVRSMAK